MFRVFSLVVLILGLAVLAATQAPAGFYVPDNSQDAVAGLASPADLDLTSGADMQAGLSCDTPSSDDEKSGCHGKTIVSPSVVAVRSVPGISPLSAGPPISVTTAMVPTAFRPPRAA